MKPLDAFLPRITPYAPGCAVPTAYSAIRAAAIQFCERTRLWRYEDSFDIPGNEAEGIAVPSGSVLLDIERVAFDRAPLSPRTAAWLDEHVDGWRDGSATGQPQFFAQLEPNTLIIAPSMQGTVTLSLWLKPSEDCTDLPDFMADQYREAIAFGALGRILTIPGQPYTNTNMAGNFLSAFESRLQELSGKGITGQQRARARTKATFY